ncbi:PI-PLC X domain-containing protein 3 [Bagarius yarrelli]|uniref:PI-PLC X domain-containing protein 3 n=1 Tax=Bagarius yarrelli TaxID=175774 RepID=A0A556VWW3_BAGYA|nr:PI-PLC X domain-containing protein 3 [Bagarius yarrelli]
MASFQGSHDSFSFYIDEASPVGPEQPETVQNFVSVFGAVAKKLMRKWLATQTMNFSSQLEAGIRFFDLRISTKPRDPENELYFAHGLFSATVREGLEQISAFLCSHAREIVFLDFNHFYGVQNLHHEKLVQMLRTVFGDRLCPVVFAEEVSLKYLWEKEYQVLVFYHNPMALEVPFLWPGQMMPCQWANTTDPEKLIQFLQTSVKERRRKGTFFVSQSRQLVEISHDIEVARVQNQLPQYLSISEDFWRSLSSLPVVYDYAAYRQVLDSFGTHYISEGTLGGTFRSLLSFSQDFIERKNSDPNLRSQILIWARARGGHAAYISKLQALDIKNLDENSNTFSMWAGSVKNLPVLINHKSGVPVLKVVTVGLDPALVLNLTMERSAMETQKKHRAVMKKRSCSISGSACDPPLLSPHVTPSPWKSIYRIGESILLECVDGRQRIGSETLLCNAGLSWTPEPKYTTCSAGTTRITRLYP